MHAGSLNWGLIFIIIGLLLLGWTTGHLPFNAIERIVDLWPVLLIALGIQLMFAKSKVPQFAYLSTLLIIGMAIYAVNPYWEDIKQGRKERAFGKIEEIVSEEVNKLLVKADFDYRDFTLTDKQSVGVQFDYDHELLEPELEYSEEAGDAVLKLIHHGDNWKRVFWKNNMPYWKLTVDRNLPVDLSLNSRKGYCYLRMSDLEVRSLDLECEKCREVVLQFGNKFPTQPILLDLNKSILRVEIPKEYGVILKDGMSLPFYVTDNLEFIEEGNDLKSDSIFTSDSILVLDIGQGLRELEINRY